MAHRRGHVTVSPGGTIFRHTEPLAPRKRPRTGSPLGTTVSTPPSGVLGETLPPTLGRRAQTAPAAASSPLTDRYRDSIPLGLSVTKDTFALPPKERRRLDPSLDVRVSGTGAADTLRFHPPGTTATEAAAGQGFGTADEARGFVPGPPTHTPEPMDPDTAENNRLLQELQDLGVEDLPFTDPAERTAAGSWWRNQADAIADAYEPDSEVGNRLLSELIDDFKEFKELLAGPNGDSFRDADPGNVVRNMNNPVLKELSHADPWVLTLDEASARQVLNWKLELDGVMNDPNVGDEVKRDKLATFQANMITLAGIQDWRDETNAAFDQAISDTERFIEETGAGRAESKAFYADMIAGLDEFIGTPVVSDAFVEEQIRVAEDNLDSLVGEFATQAGIAASGAGFGNAAFAQQLAQQATFRAARGRAQVSAEWHQYQLTTNEEFKRFYTTLQFRVGDAAAQKDIAWAGIESALTNNLNALRVSGIVSPVDFTVFDALLKALDSDTGFKDYMMQQISPNFLADLAMGASVALSPSNPLGGLALGGLSNVLRGGTL